MNTCDRTRTQGSSGNRGGCAVWWKFLRSSLFLLKNSADMFLKITVPIKSIYLVKTDFYNVMSINLKYIM